MKKLFMSLVLLTVQTALVAGPNCIGYTQNDLETGVGKGGDLRPILCGCNCNGAKYGRTKHNSCLNCYHHQASRNSAVKINFDTAKLPDLKKKNCTR